MARLVDGVVLAILAACTRAFPGHVAFWVGAAVVVGYWAISNVLGRSIGKRLLGIVIVKPDGSRPGLVRGLARTADLAVPILFFLVAPPLALIGCGIVFLGNALILVHPQRRSISDILAGTFVVLSPVGAIDTA